MCTFIIATPIPDAFELMSLVAVVWQSQSEDFALATEVA
jgi:hypothetical protein